MNLQILAAGMGVRLKPITDRIPKPALPLLNVPMFFYCYHYFNKENLNNIVANTFHLEDLLKKTISRYDRDIQFISDGKEILGTGGGTENAKKYLEGDDFFWVANGDCVFLTDDDFVTQTEKNHRLKKPIATLVVMDHPDVGVKFGGVWVDAEDRVLDIGKVKPEAAQKGYHFTGFRILSDDIFKYLPKGPSELFDALRAAMRDGHQVHIYKSSGHFFETGNQKDFLDCTQQLLNFIGQKKYTKFLGSLFKRYAPGSKLNDLGVDLKLPRSKELKYLLANENLTVFDGTNLEGFIVADKNVTIREKSNLKNVVILSDTIIPENSEIENAIIL